jgi:DNA-directed RNA polymerase specialized sigma24 family protein
MPVQDMPERGLGAEPSLPDQTLWQAVRELPTKQRHAVAYHYVADLAYAEVAAIMGTSEAAARRNAADGIKALRRTYPPASGSGQGTLPTKEMT